MKKFTLGFIIGGFICATISAIATEYIVNPNPYPVAVNGQSAEIEGYNINDKSYFQLRDVGAAIGFNVDFINNTIIVSSTPAPTTTPAVISTPVPTNNKGKSEYTEDGVPIIYEDNIAYVPTYGIQDKLKNMDLDYFVFTSNDMINRKTLEVVLSDIPRSKNNVSLINLDYYMSTLLPFINNLSK